MKRRTFCLGALFTAVAPSLPAVAQPIKGTLYRDPSCGCCGSYAAYLRQNGFTIDVKPTLELAEVSHNAGVPPDLQGCHTTFLDGYVVDGHVPVNVIRKLLSERPKIAGVTLPGMPTGSPGMTGEKTAPFTIYAFTKNAAAPTIYAIE
jgi:hypothetical protein